jgi:tetratricopeptide (TPR) repeat protein
MRQANDHWKTAGIYLLLFGIVVAAFYPSLHFQFLHWYGDDPLYVTENPHVKTGLAWANIKWGFLSTERSNWHPLTWMSHMLDCNLYGLKPWGHHLTNVLLHAANVVLLFGLLRRWTGLFWPGVVMALLFGIHPLRIESVAWISERKDVLSTLFFLLTLFAYTDYVRAKEDRKRAYGSYLLALMWFAFALMSKGMVVTLPFILLLLDYWPLNRWKTSPDDSKPDAEQAASSPVRSTQRPRPILLLTEKIPFFFLSLAVSAVTYFTQNRFGFVQTLNDYSWASRWQNAVVSYVRYLGHMLLPVDVCAYYPHPGSWPPNLVLVCALILIMISFLVWKARQRGPYLLVGWLWFLGTLVPVIGIVQLAEQAMADRYTYLSSLGLMLMTACCIDEVQQSFPRAKLALGAFLLFALSGCFILLQQQIGYFNDSTTLWARNMSLNGKYGIAHYAHALSLDHDGHTEEAIRELEDIVTAKPDWADPRNNLGLMLASRGEFKRALVHFQQTTRINPQYAAGFDSVGMTYGNLGRWDEAIAAFKRAVEIDPNYVKAYYDLGLTYWNKGLKSEAQASFEAALRIDPNDAGSKRSLASLKASLSNPPSH